MYKDTLGFVEMIIEENPCHDVIVLADLNCDIFNASHPFSNLVIDFMSSYGLISCFELDPSFDRATQYTRFNHKMKSYTLIDNILISKSLQQRVGKVFIGHYGDNVSDHCPVEIDLSLTLKACTVEKKRNNDLIHWSKLSTDNITTYENQMASLLDNIDVPFDYILHGNQCCFDCEHKFHLELYHNQILNAVKSADSVLPRSKCPFQKPWWSELLSNLKKASIEASDVWKHNGRPMTGPLYESKKGAHYMYKNEIHKNYNKCKDTMNDSLYQSLCTKDSVNFWKSWRSINKVNVDPVPRVDGSTNTEDIANVFSNHFQKTFCDVSSPAHDDLQNEFEQLYHPYLQNHMYDNISAYRISRSDMIDRHCQRFEN
jgi:hypothetical protein